MSWRVAISDNTDCRSVCNFQKAKKKGKKKKAEQVVTRQQQMPSKKESGLDVYIRYWNTAVPPNTTLYQDARKGVCNLK